MLGTYAQVAVFAAIAILIPASMLIFSKLVRPTARNSEVETMVYESAEETVGERVEIMHEYLHYFAIFLAFEIIAVVVIIWSTFSRQFQSSSGLYVASLLAFGFVLELFVLAMSRSRVG